MLNYEGLHLFIDTQKKYQLQLDRAMSNFLLI